MLAFCFPNRNPRAMQKCGQFGLAHFTILCPSVWCRTDTVESSGKKCLYLTPVRRTSRPSRSICPHLEAKSDICFTSPSELVGREGCGSVEVLPNEALQVLQADCSLVGANCSQGGVYLES